MPIPLVSYIEPKNNGEYPILEDTYVKGGFRSVQTIIERDNIPTLRRKNGMQVFVIDTTTNYQLVLGTVDMDLNNNSNWVEVVSNGNNDVAIQYFNVPNNTNGFVFKQGNVLCWKQNIVSDTWVIDYSQFIENDNVEDLIEFVGSYNWKGSFIDPHIPPNNNINNSTVSISFFYENKGFALIKIIDDGFAQTIQFD